MARNKFDVDETLETPFNIKHLLRAGVYIGRHKKKMILSLLFSAISAACSLLGPMLIQRAMRRVRAQQGLHRAGGAGHHHAGVHCGLGAAPPGPAPST